MTSRIHLVKTALWISSVCLLDARSAGAREPDPRHFAIRGDTIDFNYLATDDDLAVLDDHLNVKTICISCDEGWEGPGSQIPPIAVTDAGFARIGKCKKLQKLWLSTIHPLQVTEDCLKSLADLSDLRVFQGGVTPFTDAGIAHLAPLENLEELWLDFNTHFTDSCLGTFSQLKKLRVLRFHGAPISDAGIAKIRGLSNLEDLQLGKSQVGDAALAAIGTFSKLRTLDLQQTRVTDDGLQKLKNLQLNGSSGILVGNFLR